MTTVMLEIHVARTGKVKLISISYRLSHSVQIKLVNLCPTSFLAAEIYLLNLVASE